MSTPTFTRKGRTSLNRDRRRYYSHKNSRSRALRQVCMKKLVVEAFVKNQYNLPSFLEDPQEKCSVLKCPNVNSQVPFIPFPNKLSSLRKWCRNINFAMTYVKDRLKQGMWLSICCSHFDVRYDILNYHEWLAGHEPAKLDESAFPRYNMIIQKFKACFFPKCYNVSRANENLIFFEVPYMCELRAKWFEAVGRDDFDEEQRYCCAEHFDMDNDTIITPNSLNIICGVLPRPKSLIAKMSEERRKAKENLRIKKLEEEEKIQNLKKPKEERMFLDYQGGDTDVETTNIEIDGLLTDIKVKEMFLLSLFFDLEEMSYKQFEFFKHRVVQIIKRIRS